MAHQIETLWIEQNTNNPNAQTNQTVAKMLDDGWQIASWQPISEILYRENTQPRHRVTHYNVFLLKKETDN